VEVTVKKLSDCFRRDVYSQSTFHLVKLCRYVDLFLQMNELGRVVYNLANVVHGGIVCFFPSYEYERIVHSHWEEAGFLQKIGIKKKASIRI